MNNIIEHLYDLIHQLENKLPDNDIQNAKEFIKYNEFGVALELLCDQIYEHDIKIEKKVFLVIKELVLYMDMPTQLYEDLRTLLL